MWVHVTELTCDYEEIKWDIECDLNFGLAKERSTWKTAPCWACVAACKRACYLLMRVRDGEKNEEGTVIRSLDARMLSHCHADRIIPSSLERHRSGLDPACPAMSARM